jgi:hypothetical protein
MNCSVGTAQQRRNYYNPVSALVEDYMQFSRLGHGYAREMSPEIINRFILLFEKDAFLHWDLSKTSSDSIFLPLTPREYADLAQKTYSFRQPILDYQKVKIRLMPEGRHSVVRLTKINLVMDPGDKPVARNKIGLRLNINMDGDKPLIQNIVPDDPPPLVNRVSVGLNVIAWSNVLQSLTRKPAIRLAPGESYETLALTSGAMLQWGGMVELPVSGEEKHGLHFSTGIFYSLTPVWNAMTNYEKNYPDTLMNPSGTRFSCTTFERAPDVGETIEVTEIEIPLLLKTTINDWFSFQAGTAIGLVTGHSNVHYYLSRTGGGWVTDLTTMETVYLDPGHELDQAEYGYYRGKKFSFQKEKILSNLVVTLQAAACFKKEFGKFGAGMEPNISFGMNSYYPGTPVNDYTLSDPGSFQTILRSVKMPAFEVDFGIRFLISYLFNR